jgi:N-acetylglucosaminyldiphosphoundecaprenol N-acetyl-beta-D-mannosaminyltransferase
VESIRESGADFIWVGISSPKQEYWMAKAAPMVGRGIFIGVGAAFDFHSGAVQRAPGWMRNNGLEWLHRLCSEPRRLWRRYLVLAPLFVFKIALELSRHSKVRS